VTVVHITSECAPLAKVGDLADSVYEMVMKQNELGVRASVIMPYYTTPFIKGEKFKTILKGKITLKSVSYSFKIVIPKKKIVWFDVFLVHIEGLLDNEIIYTKRKYTERFVLFQRFALTFLNQLSSKPEVIHCHDHHAALVPFMMLHCQEFSDLRNIPSLQTVHNAHYQGVFHHNKLNLLPLFNHIHVGLLEWNNVINPLAAGIKCAWRVVTGSPTYLNELQSNKSVLSKLFKNEDKKSVGILKGINYAEWNPETDDMLVRQYSFKSVDKGKIANKDLLAKQFAQPVRPLFVFLGKLVWENGADLLPELLSDVLASSENQGNFIVMGWQDSTISKKLKKLEKAYPGQLKLYNSIDKQMEHHISAGADFQLLPSRTDPGGSKAMIAMRYGTIPVVNNVGALNDSVTDISKKGGFGIKHKGVSIKQIRSAIFRAQGLYGNPEKFKKARIVAMEKDHSWRSSVKEYNKLYKELNDLV